MVKQQPGPEEATTKAHADGPVVLEHFDDVCPGYEEPVISSATNFDRGDSLQLPPEEQVGLKSGQTPYARRLICTELPKHCNNDGVKPP